MTYNSGFNNLSGKDRERIQAALSSKEAQELKNAVKGNERDIDALKEAFSSGNMEKSKEIVQKLLKDEKTIRVLQQLQEKLSGK